MWAALQAGGGVLRKVWVAVHPRVASGNFIGQCRGIGEGMPVLHLELMMPGIAVPSFFLSGSGSATHKSELDD